jgi:hypothetical protein
VSRDDFEEWWILADPRFPRPRTKSAASRLPRALGDGVRSVLYRNDGPKSGHFTRIEDSAVSDAGRAWGAAWLDADADGRVDLAVANGLLSGRGGPSREVDLWNETSAGWTDFSKGDWKIDLGEDGITGPQPERLFINLGDGTFADAGYVGGFDTTADLRGLVAADITADAAPDLVGAAFLDSPVIYVNTNAGNPGRVRIRLDGTGSNWDAAAAPSVSRPAAGTQIPRRGGRRVVPSRMGALRRFRIRRGEATSTVSRCSGLGIEVRSRQTRRRAADDRRDRSPARSRPPPSGAATGRP